MLDVDFETKHHHPRCMNWRNQWKKVLGFGENFKNYGRLGIGIGMNPNWRTTSYDGTVEGDGGGIWWWLLEVGGGGSWSISISILYIYIY